MPVKLFIFIALYTNFAQGSDQIKSQYVCFPHVAKSQSGFKSILAIANIHNEIHTLNLKLHTASGHVIKNLEMEANSFTQLDPNQWHDTTGQVEWLEIESEHEIQSSLSFAHNQGAFTAHPGLSQPLHSHVFPTSATGWTGIVVLNPNQEPATLIYQALDSSGQIIATVETQITSGNREVILASTLFPQTETHQVRVHSEHPLYALALNGGSNYLTSHVFDQEGPDPITMKRQLYAVASETNSPFFQEAWRFATMKGAVFIGSPSVDQTLPALALANPEFTAFVLEPEIVVPDLVDEIDDMCRRLDDDVYVDTAFGIITSRPDQISSYIDRLLAHQPVANLKIYGVAPSYHYRNLAPDYGIDVQHHCLSNAGAFLSVCDDSQRATLERIQEGMVDADVLIFGTHGSPSLLALDNGAQIYGSSFGLQGYDGQDYQLTHQSILTFAESCLTGRINGGPTQVDHRFDDMSEGHIDESVVLSFLQSGSLNFLAATHLAVSTVTPHNTLIEQAILQGESLGKALKHWKNRHILMSESYQVSMPGGPINDDDFTHDWLAFQTRNWVLFGDPQTRLTDTLHQPINCILNKQETQTKDTLDVEVDLQFVRDGRDLSNGFYYAKVRYEGNQVAVQGIGVGFFHIDYDRPLESFEVTSVNGVKDRYAFDPYPANAFIQDTGDQLLVMVPSFVTESFGGVMNIQIRLNFASAEEVPNGLRQPIRKTALLRQPIH